MAEGIVVLSACASEEEAEHLGRMLVERRLAACVNIVPRIRSIYRWKDAKGSEKICDEPESMLLIKTTESRFKELSAALRSAHSYDLPEIIALPINDGLPQYLEWLARP